jgi:hypothetical protein
MAILEIQISWLAFLSQKILQKSDLDFFLTDHPLQFRDLVVFLLQLVASTEGLGDPRSPEPFSFSFFFQFESVTG